MVKNGGGKEILELVNKARAESGIEVDDVGQ
jgi:hypothetical protein